MEQRELIDIKVVMDESFYDLFQYINNCDDAEIIEASAQVMYNRILKSLISKVES